MGKGDKRTKRGKLFRGSHGKPNPGNRHGAPVKPEPKPAAKPKAPREQPAAPASPPAT
ncbi:MAG TPA: 30S ribosomal protein THX [Anaerolineae bacterium]|nr:30S ribosomal protein THX [Anaerolineae bacterium]